MDDFFVTRTICVHLCKSVAKKSFGAAGFEPTTCRRGDRTTTVIDPVRHDLDLIYNIVPFLRHRRD